MSLLLLRLFLWRYSPTWALASSILRLQASLSSADLLHFLYINVLLTSLSTASKHLPPRLPNGLLPSIYSFTALLGTVSLFFPITWPTLWSFLNLVFLVNSISLYKSEISWLYLFRYCPLTNTGRIKCLCKYFISAY